SMAPFCGRLSLLEKKSKDFVEDCAASQANAATLSAKFSTLFIPATATATRDANTDSPCTIADASASVSPGLRSFAADKVLLNGPVFPSASVHCKEGSVGDCR